MKKDSWIFTSRAKQELASRDVVSRWMYHHMRIGKGVKSPYGDHLWLDIRHLGAHHIKTKLREVEEICNEFLDRDPITQLIPVRPCQHYSMGGVRTNKDGAAYGLKGLYSAGEAACWDMHGFNRLGGNSLAETIVAGRIVGGKIVEFLQGYQVDFKTACSPGCGQETTGKNREPGYAGVEKKTRTICARLWVMRLWRESAFSESTMIFRRPSISCR